MSADDYVTRVLHSPQEVPAQDWNKLLAQQDHASPFMRHEYLSAMHSSGCATHATGWTPCFITLWQVGAEPNQDTLVGACAVYLKAHSYGEYVFDWAWADAYAQHGLDYYPKAVVASPFTPVPGARLLARDAQARQALLRALITWCKEKGLSSLHLLFANEMDLASCIEAGLLLRHTVQFHWNNQKFSDFDHFLASLAQDKRKKIKQERRKVALAEVVFRSATGAEITSDDWDFFYRCYARTYLEHGNQPYLNRTFFARLAQTMGHNCLLFTAERGQQRIPIATSLILLGEEKGGKVAYGRYWGALERVDCLHFEACYYQPIQWCIQQGYQRFEGGAQGEHKMARALLPVKTSSAHWLAHPAFADAVERFLEREGQGVASYMEDLSNRSPLRQEK